ncbi:MAG: response regulator [Methanophagales archaeon]|nr:response regulator [Methanophagales archaeon]
MKRYSVATAYTGEAAIAIAQEKAYDIIFIDLKQPTINGLDTYLTIRANNPEEMAVMMTRCRQEMADLVEEALRARFCPLVPLQAPGYGTVARAGSRLRYGRRDKKLYDRIE